MADGVIRRIIKLILDPSSADQVEKDTKGVAGEVENVWKDAAAKIATYLGAAFLLKKMVDFGKASIAAAAESEAAWNELGGAIAAAGGNFGELEDGLRSASAAFQEATIHEDDDYAKSLARMVALTGDVSASTHNMGLVANVAARFFNGDLGPATDMVAKAMNGNTAALGKMGIQAKTAQEALQILADRSMGAAEQRTETFSGKLAQLNNFWGDFLEEVGFAIIGSNGAADGLDILRGTVEKLTDWVSRNREEISEWVTRGVNFAITAADVLIRALMGMGNILQGGFNTALGIAAKGLGMLARGYATATEAAASFIMRFAPETAAKMMETASGIRENADAINEWADAAIKAGSEQVGKGIDNLANPLFTPASLTGGTRRPRAALPGGSGGPRAAAGTKTAEQENIEKAMTEFEKAGERITIMQTTLGNNFNWIEAEIKRTTDLLMAMVENGVDPADEGFQALQRSLSFLSAETSTADQALIDMNKRLMEDSVIATMTGVESYAMLKDQQSELARTMRTLISQGMNPQDARLRALAERYREVTQTIEQQTLAMQFQAGAAGFLGDAVGAAMEGGIGPAASAKSRQNRIEGTEMLVRAAGFALFGNPVGAGAALRQAAGHFALAAAWGALASSSRRPAAASSVSIPAAATGGSAGGGTSTTAARQSSARATESSRQPSADVAIYMVGPGFDAVNPAVQRVVYGAQKNASERYGNNARVRVVRTS